MKHTITITKQVLLENDYSDNFDCPLAIALKNHFKNLSHVYVSVNWFEFETPELGFVKRDFHSCKILSNNEDDLDLEDLIHDYSTGIVEDDLVEDIVFDFITTKSI